MKISLKKEALLKAIIITLPFGWIDVLPFPYTSLTFLLIYVYLAAALLLLPHSLSWATIKSYSSYLILMWLIMLWKTLFDDGLTVFGSSSQLRQILFFTVFFSFAVTDVRRMAAQREFIEKYFVLAMLGMLLVYFAGYTYEHEATGRLTIRGLNPNVAALYSATSVIICIDILMRGKRRGLKNVPQILIVLLLPLLVYVVYRSGSRAGIIILAAAIVTYYAGWKNITRRQALAIIASGPVIVSVVAVLFTTGPVSERFSEIEDDVRFRAILPASLQVVSENPVFGAGFDRASLAVAEMAGRHVSPHNEFLKVATSSGLFGLSLFCIFLYKLLKQAVNYRKLTGSALMLAILLIVILYLGSGGGALQLPFIWIMFLLILAPSSAQRSQVLNERDPIREIKAPAYIRN